MLSKRQRLKRIAIEEMGGECVLCGYHRCDAALHFHHLNPHEKDYNISEKSNWYDIEKELKKCVLLCSNCHRETHSGLIDHETLAELAER
jgi:5-methylcytosine-specific restriction endonuclease McrA